MAFAVSTSSVPDGAAADPLAAPWLTRVARAVAVALAAAFVVALISGSGAKTASGRLGGDYPAFYAAGRLITSHERSSMYNPARQAETQQGLFPGDSDDGLLYFAYPPHTALVYLPLSHLPYRLSYALHTVLMLGATVAALYLVRPMLPAVDRHFELAVIGAISFYPMYRAITGGQNTALTLLLLAGSWRAIEGRRDILSGVLLGLLLFKPQFALPIIGLHLLARRWRLVLSAACTAMTCWGIGAALLGFDWLGDWFESVRFFSDLDAHVNRRNAVSFLGVADTVFGVGNNAGRALGGAMALATVVALIALWRNHGPRNLCAPMIVALPAIVLISPHAMFYDAGLLVIPLAAMVAARHVHVRQAAIVLWGAGLLDVAKHGVGLTPLFGVTVAVFVIALVNARRYEPLPQGVAT